MFMETKEFVKWHDSKENYEKYSESFDEIYDIFDEKSSDHSGYVDKEYEGLSDEDKEKVTEIVKSCESAVNECAMTESNEGKVNFTIEYVQYNDGFYDDTDTEDIIASSAKEAIDKFKEDHDEEIVSVYDDSDIFYDIDTGVELDESKKVVKEAGQLSNGLLKEFDDNAWSGFAGAEFIKSDPLIFTSNDGYVIISGTGKNDKSCRVEIGLYTDAEDDYEAYSKEFKSLEDSKKVAETAARTIKDAYNHDTIVDVLLTDDFDRIL